MPITTTRCPVVDMPVTRISDFEDHTTRIICAEFDEPTGVCRTKARTLNRSPLSRLLERVAEDALATKDTRCVMF